MTRHRWTNDDDIMTLYLYKFGNKGLQFTLEKIAEKLEIPFDSLKMRMANIRYIDKKVGLPNVANRTVNIYREFNEMPETELRSLVLKILNDCDAKSKR